MTKEEKEKLLADLQIEFDKQNKIVVDGQQELLRLQGEYRAINKMEVEDGGESKSTE